MIITLSTTSFGMARMIGTRRESHERGYDLCSRLKRDWWRRLSLVLHFRFQDVYNSHQAAFILYRVLLPEATLS